MDIGDYDDAQKLVARVGDEYLQEVLARAEIGQFTARSWAYWHYRLRLAMPEKVPPMPPRRIA